MGFTLNSGRVEDLDTPDSHITLIRAQWREFAAFAWENFLATGRGAIVIDLRNSSKSESGLNVPTFWIAAEGENLKARGGWPNDAISEAIETYDPEQDVIFLFLRLDGDVFHYNVSDELTPPIAYEKRTGSRTRSSVISD